MTLIDTEPTPTRRFSRHRWLIAAAAAAVVAVVVGGLVLVAGDDDTETQSTSAPSTAVSTTAAATPARVTAAQDVARGFLDAEKVTFDAERASSYLTAEAFAETAGTPEEYRLLLSFLEATGAKTINIDCQHHDDSAAGIVIRCTYDDHMFRSDQLGLGPYTGSYQDLTVRDGKIVEVSGYAPLEPFSSQIWNPFKQWVTAEHPDDVPVMYEGSGWRLTEESIPLWAQHLQEYVQAVLTGPETYAADVDAICATQAAQLGELAAPAEGALNQVAAWHTAAAAIMDDAHGELIALDKPPRMDTQVYSNFYGGLARLVRLAQESAEAATARDRARLAELDTEFLEARQAMSAGPTGSGLEDCLASLPS